MVSVNLLNTGDSDGLYLRIVMIYHRPRLVIVTKKKKGQGENDLKLQQRAKIQHGLKGLMESTVKNQQNTWSTLCIGILN